MSSKIMKQDYEIKNLREKEEELRRKSEQLNQLNRKHDNLNKEKEDLLNDINMKNGKLNDGQKKHNILETEIQERETEKLNLISDLRKYEKDLKALKEQNENYINKLEKVKQFLNKT